MHDASRLPDRDRAVLAFAAEHRLVLERQVERLLGLGRRPTRGRLQRLAALGYLGSGCVLADPHYQIRPRGLAAIGSTLPAPRDRHGAYKHDVGLAWLWLAAREGSFGPLREVLSERRLRSHDGARERPDEPYGVRLGGNDRYGNERLHYPDLLLIDPYGRRLALELELSTKGRERREAILGGYAADTRIERVLYLVEALPAGRTIQRALEATVREMELPDRVRFQPIRPFCPTTEAVSPGVPRRAVARRPAEVAR